MADISFSLQRGFQSVVDPGDGGTATITQGTATPGAGDIELRISGTAGWTQFEVYAAMEAFMRFLADTNYSTAVPGA